MEAFLLSTGMITLAEMGDKTQLLAFLLATRFKKPIPIIFGITLATLLNHGLAGAVGTYITHLLSPNILRWILGLSFIGMACWTLIPDKIENESTSLTRHFGILGTTFITFFLAEMGDKTQLATVALAAHYTAPIIVIMGTTLGMLIADVPAVFIGQKFAHKISFTLLHRIAATLFFLMGIFILGQGTFF